MKHEDKEKRLFVSDRAKININIYLNTMGANKKFTKFVHVIQQ